MYFYVICTLFDITKTDVVSYRNGIDSLYKRNQQRNWQVIAQLVQYRAQPLILTEPVKTSADIANYNFGHRYSGTHSVWHCIYAVSQEDLYTVNDDRFFYLKNNFDQVPIISGLDETVTLEKNIIDVSENSNICFYDQNTWKNQIDVDFDYLKNTVDGK